MKKKGKRRCNSKSNNQSKNKRNSKRKQHNRRTRKRQSGGKVIASGGFGCVFKPALRCNNTTEVPSDNTISKLMLTRHATDEFRLIQTLNQRLSAIPNHARYFLVSDFELCEPAALTSRDLTRFNDKCKAMTKRKLNASNLNAHLNEVRVLNMPNGGIDVDRYLAQTRPNTWTRLNASLIDLLNNAILPMNRLNIFHCDIKDKNILVATSSENDGLRTRVIDWGLSVLYGEDNANDVDTDSDSDRDRDNRSIPKHLYRRPFQYNVPFSNVLFSDLFMNAYNKFLNKYSNPFTYQIREFVVNYLVLWVRARGAGHLNNIREWIGKLTELTVNQHIDVERSKHIFEHQFTYFYIIQYLTQILQTYTLNGKFYILTYMEDVFLKNVDVWGFVMIYSKMFNRLNPSNPTHLACMQKIKHIVIYWLYDMPTQVINVDTLLTELNVLNALLHDCT